MCGNKHGDGMGGSGVWPPSVGASFLQLNVSGKESVSKAGPGVTNCDGWYRGGWYCGRSYRGVLAPRPMFDEKEL